MKIHVSTTISAQVLVIPAVTSHIDIYSSNVNKLQVYLYLGPKKYSASHSLTEKYSLSFTPQILLPKSRMFIDCFIWKKEGF